MKMSLEQADIGYSAQNVSRNKLNVCQEPKGGIDVPPRAQAPWQICIEGGP